MNAQRLFTLSKQLHQEITSLKLVVTMNQLVQQLQDAINTPNEGTQRAVENTLKQLHEKLATAPSNQFSPGIRAETDELAIQSRLPVNRMIGKGLSEELVNCFAEGYTSVQTLDKMKQLAKDIQSLATALEQINNAFGTLGIPDEELEPGQSVIGMLIPRESIDGSLRSFQKELAFFAHFLGLLTEVVEGSYDHSEVYSLHASDFGIDVIATLNVAATFATIVGGVKAAYDIIRGFRTLKQDAENLGVDEKLIKELTKKGQSRMESKLDEITAEVFNECKVDDTGRVNELKTGIRLSLNGLANRLDRGFKFEVRTSLPEKSPPEEQERAQQIAAFSTIRFEQLEGARVLELPEGEERNEDAEKAELGHKKPRKKQTADS